MLATPSAGRVILRHYYTVNVPPYLRDETGTLLAGELARLLAGLSAKALAAFMADGPGKGRAAAAVS